MNGYNYMIIRLTPSLVNEEFANVGVLLLCENLNFLKVKILERLSDRIRRYFTGFSNRIYTKAAASVREAISCKCGHETANDTFAAMSQAVLGLLSFGNIRLLVSEKQPDEVLSELFSSYVQEETGDRSSRQRMMEQRIATAVGTRPWFPKYKHMDYLSNRGYNLELRYVAEKRKCVLPIDFNYDSAKKAIDSTCLWDNRIRMFSSQLPPKIILPYRLTTADTNIRDTAMDFIDGQDKSRVVSMDIEDTERLAFEMAL